jgi:predicted transport protein
MEHPFQNSESSVTKLYEALMKQVRTLGQITVEPKKTSIHVKHGAAFLGVHPKKKWLDLNIVSQVAIKSAKVLKAEQISKSRYHNLVRIANAEDLTPELLGWVKQAYDLLAPKP